MMIRLLAAIFGFALIHLSYQVNTDDYNEQDKPQDIIRKVLAFARAEMGISSLPADFSNERLRELASIMSTNDEMNVDAKENVPDSEEETTEDEFADEYVALDDGKHIDTEYIDTEYYDDYEHEEYGYDDDDSVLDYGDYSYAYGVHNESSLYDGYDDYYEDGL